MIAFYILSTIAIVAIVAIVLIGIHRVVCWVEDKFRRV